LLTIVGSVGQVAVVEKRFAGFNVARAVAVIHPLQHIAPEWIALCLRSPLSKYLLGSRANTTVQTTINLKDLRALPIPLPPERERCSIAEFIGALDDRITLLRETNATLEAIAQALFKSWFVDFDPVRAKQQGLVPEGMEEATAALFPDHFEESELGLVPRGWRVVSLGEFVSTTIGGLWGKDSQEEIDLVPAISLRGVDLEHLRSYGFSAQAPIRWVKKSALENRWLQESQVLIGGSGAGPCGRSLWAGAGFEAMYGMPVIFSNFVKRFECGVPARAIYVDRLLAGMRETKEIWNFINGTSVPNLDDKLLLSTKKVVLPSDDVLGAYEDIARAIYRKLYDQKAQTLSSLRDTLLPRLISGQLRLPDDSLAKPEDLLEEIA
jgi:type I restriction enzyme, S subunit